MASPPRAMHDPHDLHPEYRERLIVGTDEVGTGSLAGPVVAAACIVPIFDPFIQSYIKDSKAVSKKTTRAELAQGIKECALVYDIQQIPQSTVEIIGPRKSANRAMASAVNGCVLRLKQLVPRHRKLIAVVDGEFALDLDGVEQTSVIKADQKFLTVAAASLLAKDFRDRLMDDLGRTFPQYRFEKNSGYGTDEHVAAIHEYGMCHLHRTSMALSALRKWEDRFLQTARTSLRRESRPASRR